jgi:hypothetical protein
MKRKSRFILGKTKRNLKVKYRRRKGEERQEKEELYIDERRNENPRFLFNLGQLSQTQPKRIMSSYASAVFLVMRHMFSIINDVEAMQNL